MIDNSVPLPGTPDFAVVLVEISNNCLGLTLDTRHTDTLCITRLTIAVAIASACHDGRRRSVERIRSYR